jgi:hypothetical protein
MLERAPFVLDSLNGIDDIDLDCIEGQSRVDLPELRQSGIGVCGDVTRRGVQWKLLRLHGRSPGKDTARENSAVAHPFPLREPSRRLFRQSRLVRD